MQYLYKCSGCGPNSAGWVSSPCQQVGPSLVQAVAHLAPAQLRTGDQLAHKESQEFQGHLKNLMTKPVNKLVCSHQQDPTHIKQTAHLTKPLARSLNQTKAGPNLNWRAWFCTIWRSAWCISVGKTINHWLCHFTFYYNDFQGTYKHNFVKYVCKGARSMKAVAYATVGTLLKVCMWQYVVVF